MSSIYKARYCYGDKQRCARYQLVNVVGGDRILPDLYPNERDRVPNLVAMR